MWRSIFFLFFLITASLCGQNVSYKKTDIALGEPVVINMGKINSVWRPILNTIEMPTPDADQTRLKEIKSELQKKYPVKTTSGQQYNKTSHSSSGTAKLPVLNRNFEGNLQNSGVPMDNDMAISNGGKVISVTNALIFIYDVNTNTLLKAMPLDTFGKGFGLNFAKYDPKVIYDPIADRFIITYLNGFYSTSTYITVAFSQTNDPMGNWNLYAIPGNPHSLAQWSDYPMISITEKDYFLTINLLRNGQPWQTGFVETLIWQIGKDKGYNGQAITSTMYNNIEFDGRKIRNLCPAKGGDEIKSPNMYFMSNRNLAANNDSLFLVEVTNTQESGLATLTAKMIKSPVSYFVPPNARQANNLFLQTNDSRILGAYFHNNQIQFVQNTLDTFTGHSAIFHGVVSNLSASIPTVKAHLISDTALDLGYPNISYCGTNITHTGLSEPENESIISFSHSSPTVFAGVSAVYYDNEGNYSEVLRIKNGDNYIDYLPGAYERWGDYAGSQRKYNEPGKVWMAGTFGQSNKKYGTWIAELSSPQERIVTPVAPSTLFFPNPVGETASISFTLDAEETLIFSVYDDIGKLVIKLSETMAEEGENIFSFSTAPLRSGTYFLVAESGTKTIAKEKFIKY